MVPSIRRISFQCFTCVAAASLAVILLNGCSGQPNWSDDEARVIEALREIAAAQEVFQRAGYLDANYDGIGDYGTFDMLADPAGDRRIAPLANPLYTTRRVGKYELYLKLVEGYGKDSPPAWECQAFTSEKGLHCFYADTSGVVRYADRRETATAESPVVADPSTDA